MKENTNTTSETNEQALEPASRISHDLKNSVLIVSVVANLTIFIAWILLQMTNQYDASLASFILGR